jgi:hypothetical protein
MQNDENRGYKPPEKDKADVTHTIARVGISSIPYVGGVAAEFFTTLFAAPIEKRRQKWMERVAKGLQELEKVKDLNIDNLKNNENFVTITMQATQIAMRNHQTEKLEALRNAVLNTSLKIAIDEDLQLMFLSFIDTFTVSHLKLMDLLNDPHNWVIKNDIAFVKSDRPDVVFEQSFQDFKARRKYYDIFVKDLYSRGLTIKDIAYLSTDLYGTLVTQATDTGKEFMNFVTSPINS